MKTRVMVRLDDLVGITEISERTGASPQSVCNWIARRSDFPAPIISLALGPIFLWSQVEPWVETSLRKQRRKETTP